MPDNGWLNHQLSQELPVLRAAGEGQEVEFKREIPQQVDDLGKEIAAFANSGGGIILLGVSDEGELVGLSGLYDAKERDRLLRRIEGICRNVVKPAITPTLSFAEEDSKIVLAIIVPRGSQPVYYSHSRPYIRHSTVSRPAEPHEVVELVSNWLSLLKGESKEENVYGQYLAEVAQSLIEIIIHGDEIYERRVSPWLELLRSQYRQVAYELRQRASDNRNADEELSKALAGLADTLDDVAHFRLALGRESWTNFEGLVKQAVKQASFIKERWIDTAVPSTISSDAARDALASSAKRLNNLASRTSMLAQQGRIEEVQAEAAEIGHTLLKLSYSQAPVMGENPCERLRDIGRKLHVLETARIYLDGGRSLQGVMDAINDANEKMNSLKGRLFEASNSASIEM